MSMRLDKFLAQMGAGTRQEVKQYIRKGTVTVNGQPAGRPEQKVNPEVDRISLNGTLITYVTYEYYMLNKPAGVVSATEDRRDKTVLDLIGDKIRKDLFPVGRLDKDTEGLLLITNDGALAHALLSPRKHVDKTYYAEVSGTVDQKDISAFAQGIDIGTKEQPELTMPAHLDIAAAGIDCPSGTISRIRLTIQEGKFHQVKRMFRAIGREVLYLKRETMGSLVLDEQLAPGEYRKLTPEEEMRLKTIGEQHAEKTDTDRD